MSPAGDIVFIVDAATGPALQFRPAGGPLGSLEHPFPDGASGQGAAVDGQGNTYLAWTRAGTLEERVRMRDGSLTAIRTVQTSVLGGEVAVSRDGKATFVWLANNADRTGAARTLGTDGTFGPVQTITVAGESTRDVDLGVAANGDATFAWTTPSAPPNTKVKARTLGFSSQTLSAVLDISTPPSPELSDMARVVVDPAGNATLVWRHLTSTASLIETRQLLVAGTLGSTQVLNGPSSTAQGHDVAVDDAGRARITWTQHAIPGTDPFLPATCFSAVGSSCGARLDLATAQALSTTVAVGPAGDALVGFDAPGSTQARFLPHPGSGLPPGPSHTLSSSTSSAPLVAVDGAGNGVAAWTEGGAAKAAGFDATPPVLQSFSIPSAVDRGSVFSASASVFDVWGTTIRWSFGDGGTAEGASVQHTFQQAGTFQVQFTATDGAGASVSGSGQVIVRDTSTPATTGTGAVTGAGGLGTGGGQTTFTDTQAPSLGPVSMSRKRFRVARAATAVSARRRSRAGSGTSFGFSLSENAAVVIAIERKTAGRRVGRRCARARGRAPRRRRCTRFVSAGSALTRNLPAGANRVSFSGRIGRRALKPGAYRANLTATDAAGNRSSERSTNFVIVR